MLEVKRAMAAPIAEVHAVHVTPARSAYVLALVVGVLTSCSGDQDAGTPAPTPTSSAVSEAASSDETSAEPADPQAEVDAALAFVQEQAPHYDLSLPGGIVLVTEGGSTASFAFGEARLKPRRPMTVDAPFPIASITKTLVATLVLQLVDEGVLSLDDTVEQWLPGLVEDGDRITIEHLLSHRSGLVDPEGYGWGAPITEANLKAFLDHPLAGQPGKKTRYANVNYWVLGRVVEAATSRTLARELQSRIFDPAGMESTRLATDLDRISGLPRGYNRRDKDVTPPRFVGAWAAGGVVSTAADLAAFYDALYSGRLLPEAAVADMTTPRGTLEAGLADYGLGQVIADLECGTLTGHDGWISGYRSMAFRNPDTGRTVITLLNSTSPTVEDAIFGLTLDAMCY